MSPTEMANTATSGQATTFSAVTESAIPTDFATDSDAGVATSEAAVTTENAPQLKADWSTPTTVAVVPVATPPALGVAAAAPVAPVAPAAPVVPVPLLTQVSGPVFSLAQGTAGEQTVTITVTPENLGPVTVQARTTGGAMHIELFAPSTAGRQALQVLLTDLRRDLAIAGISTSVTLSNAAAPHPVAALHAGSNASGDQQSGNTAGGMNQQRESGAGSAAQQDSQRNGAGQTDVDQHGNSQHTASTPHSTDPHSADQNTTPAQNAPDTNRTADDGRQLGAEALSDRPAIGSNRSLDVMA